MATNPTLLTMPIAENGQKNAIPATQAAAGDGLLSQSTGFPPETALPLGAGGKAPTREDFNGAFNLLSDIAFYTQKGWTFEYDATQAYYKGCIVMDATDGLRYECINDVAAGTILPSADTNNDYWREYSPGGVPLGTILAYGADAAEPPYGFLFCEGQAVSRTLYPDLFDLYGTKWGAGDGSTTFNIPNLIEAAMLNGSYTKTSYTTAGSYTFTAPKSGTYKITVKGAGGGGGNGASISSWYYGGCGGGEGGTSFAWEHLDAGDIVTVVVGAGGAGGVYAAGTTNLGANGGDTTAVINLTTITGGGGSGGRLGGSGDIVGAPGNVWNIETTSGAWGASGGGEGGGIGGNNATLPTNGTHGGGGGGGGYGYAGGKGGDGYATIEYIGISMKYMVKAYDAPTPSSAQIDLSQYASDLAARLTREQTPAFNKRDVVTVSGAYIAPVTGWYKITVKGGGGGGGGGSYKTNVCSRGGGGGGEGGTTIGFEKLTAGQTASVVIGAGGAGGTAASEALFGGAGGNGGNSTVTVNSHTYTGGGGEGGSGVTGMPGGSGTINGAPGTVGETSNVNSVGAYGGPGGGNGASGYTGTATQGGGGGGGYGLASPASTENGRTGGAGYCWIEYWDGSL